MIKRLMVGIALVLMLAAAQRVEAAHPLITDDTGTQGQWKTQVETNFEYDFERLDDGSEKTHEISVTISFGLFETLDLVVTVPYQFLRGKSGGSVETANGFSDVVLEAKWRFWECGPYSLAVKPGVSFPSGDEDKGLGNGRASPQGYLIGTAEWEPFTVHANLGYLRNENRVGDETDLWHVSVAGEYEIIKDLKLVANVGAERNTDRSSDTPPAFILGGVIYSVTEWLDLDVGVKGGLTRPEADYAILAGMAFRF